MKTYKKTQNVRLSPNFVSKEFNCKCGCNTDTLIDERLVDYLQKIRDHFGRQLIITSGFRCPAHNAAVGGGKHSKHMEGRAADIQVPGIAPSEVAKYAESLGAKGIGLYPNFVHVDTRDSKYFWYGSSQQPRETFGGAAPEVPKVTAPAPDPKPSKTITQIAREVIQGKWGNGATRIKRLEAAGYSYAQVQAKVNELLR